MRLTLARVVIVLCLLALTGCCSLDLRGPRVVTSQGTIYNGISSDAISQMLGAPISVNTPGSWKYMSYWHNFAQPMWGCQEVVWPVDAEFLVVYAADGHVRLFGFTDKRKP